MCVRVRLLVCMHYTRVCLCASASVPACACTPAWPQVHKHAHVNVSTRIDSDTRRSMPACDACLWFCGCACAHTCLWFCGCACAHVYLWFCRCECAHACVSLWLCMCSCVSDSAVVHVLTRVCDSVAVFTRVWFCGCECAHMCLCAHANTHGYMCTNVLVRMCTHASMCVQVQECPQHVTLWLRVSSRVLWKRPSCVKQWEQLLLAGGWAGTTAPWPWVPCELSDPLSLHILICDVRSFRRNLPLGVTVRSSQVTLWAELEAGSEAALSWLWVLLTLLLFSDPVVEVTRGRLFSSSCLGTCNDVCSTSAWVINHSFSLFRQTDLEIIIMNSPAPLLSWRDWLLTSLTEPAPTSAFPSSHQVHCVIKPPDMWPNQDGVWRIQGSIYHSETCAVRIKIHSIPSRLVRWN